MSKETEFFIYLLEHYSEYKEIPSNQILKVWDENDLTEYIFDKYFIYHMETITNAFKDIDNLLAHGEPLY